MKKVVFITSCRFWRNGAGVWARTRELIVYLSRHTTLVIVFVDGVRGSVVENLKAFETHFRFIPIAQKFPTAEADLVAAVHTVCTALGPADTYIVDKLEYSFLLAALPRSGQRLVDTHDLLSQKTRSMEQHGYRPRIPMSEQTEKEILGRYDGVMCIQAEEYALVCDWLGRDSAILAPHPATINPQPFRDEVRSIGFVASTWLPNTDGLKWFLDAVWPAFHDRGINLDIHGPIKRSFLNDATPRVRFHGFTESLDEIYAGIDIVFNPVRFGSGLKIKTVEALGNGLPLVTTSEGARGFRELHGRALLLADDGPAFVSALDALINDRALRHRLGTGALAYARERLSPHACFGELLQRINAP